MLPVLSTTSDVAQPISAARKSYLWLGALGLCMVLMFIGLGSYTFVDPDEGRYAEIPREMIESGDWITPRLNYVPYFEKPPLSYWLEAASMEALGETEFAVRLVPAICGVLGLLVALWLGGLTAGGTAGRWVPAVLATSLLYFAIARLPITDMPLSVAFAASLTAWWAADRAKRRPLGEGISRAAAPWLLVFSGVTLGLAVLAKGPVAIVLYVGVIGVFLVWDRRLLAGLWSLALPVLLGSAVAAPWFIAVQQRNPGFAHYFFVVQHLQRFTGEHFEEHVEPFYWFVPVVFAGMLCWSVLWFVSGRLCVRTWRETSPEGRRAAMFLLSWFAVVFLFFSASSCKLTSYVLPCLWPLAVATSWMAIRLFSEARLSGALKLILVGLGVSVIAFSVLGFWYAGCQEEVPFSELQTPSLIMVGLWGIAGLMYALLPMVRRAERRMGLMVLASLICLGGLLLPFSVVARHRDVAPLIPAALKPPDPGAGWRLAQYRTYDQSFGFYTRSRIVLIENIGELKLGPEQPDGDQWFLKGKDNIDRLAAQGPLALVVSDREAHQVARDHGLSIWAINRDRGLLLNEEGLKIVESTPNGGAP